MSFSITTVNTPAPILADPSESTLTQLHPGGAAALPGPAHAAAPADEASLREAMKRCSPATVAAVLTFRATGDFAHLPAIVTGVIERFVERSLRDKLATPSDDLRLV